MKHARWAQNILKYIKGKFVFREESYNIKNDNILANYGRGIYGRDIYGRDMLDAGHPQMEAHTQDYVGWNTVEKVTSEI